MIYLPQALVGSRVRLIESCIGLIVTHVRLIGTCVASTSVSRYQHVGIGNVKAPQGGSKPT